MHDELLEDGQPVEVFPVVHATCAYHLVGIWYLHNILSTKQHCNALNSKGKETNFRIYTQQLHVHMDTDLIETADTSMFWLPSSQSYELQMYELQIHTCSTVLQ